MKILIYKGIKFDDFQLYNGDSGDYGDYFSNSLDRFSSADVYICPCCVKKYGLYQETETTEEENEINIEWLMEHKEDAHPICGVKGCNNGNSYDISFNTENCTLEDNTNFIKEEDII